MVAVVEPAFPPPPPPPPPHRRPVRLLVSILAWWAGGVSPGFMPGRLGGRCRFLSPAEPLFCAGPNRVADAAGAVWACGDSFLADDKE